MCDGGFGRSNIVHRAEGKTHLLFPPPSTHLHNSRYEFVRLSGIVRLNALVGISSTTGLARRMNQRSRVRTNAIHVIIQSTWNPGHHHRTMNNTALRLTKTREASRDDRLCDDDTSDMCHFMPKHVGREEAQRPSEVCKGCQSCSDSIFFRVFMSFWEMTLCMNVILAV